MATWRIPHKAVDPLPTLFVFYCDPAMPLRPWRKCAVMVPWVARKPLEAVAPMPSAGDVELDITSIVGRIDNMDAELITRFKDVTPDGGVIELVVWRVPRPVSPSTHEFKYRAAYAVNGVRVVGFDNERGKGDHCHISGHERAYAFVSVERLVEDFIAAVDAARRIE